MSNGLCSRCWQRDPDRAINQAENLACVLDDPPWWIVPFAAYASERMSIGRVSVLPQMIANEGGYLLNTASAAGLLTQIGSLAYSVTKGAAVSLAEFLAIAHHHQGIRVSVLCPQAVRTNILANSPDAVGDGSEDWESNLASGDGVLEAADVAQACLDAIDEERFWVLPHQEVGKYARLKATDIDRWLNGRRRFQDALFPDGPLPGDAMAPM